MITLTDINIAYRNASSDERQEFINLILPALKESSIFKNAINEALLTSELRPIKRIAELETVTGLNDYSDFDEEEREPSIPEKIDRLAEKVNGIESRPISMTFSNTVELSPTTKTEVRANLLVEDLKDSGKEFLNNHEITNFLKSRLPESCKIGANVQNIRKIKQDVLRAAKRMFPEIEINKSKNGRRETRLILGL